jgi:RimJ/RimL family protein N-acetyltransferase
MSSSVFSDSSRLLFEPLRRDHATGLFEPLRDPRVWEHIGETPLTTVAALAARFDRVASGPPPDRFNENWLNYAVRLKEDGTLIGWLQATILEPRAEVSYLFGPEHWGHGYATEAMSAFQDNLRQNLHVGELWAATAPQNTRSIRLLRRLGYIELCDSWPTFLSYEDGDLVFVLR